MITNGYQGLSKSVNPVSKSGVSLSLGSMKDLPASVERWSGIIEYTVITNFPDAPTNKFSDLHMESNFELVLQVPNVSMNVTS